MISFSFRNKQLPFTWVVSPKKNFGFKVGITMFGDIDDVVVYLPVVYNSTYTKTKTLNNKIQLI